MKKILSLLLILISWNCFAQSTAGLIAHWDMNGTANDVSGHGHTGHMYNVVPAADRNGVAGNAYYFNGVDSRITAGYLPDLNVTQISMCAIIKVMGFYSGLCQANEIFIRGDRITTGNYLLEFDDNYVGTTSTLCYIFDSTQECINATCGTNAGASPAVSYYTPTMSENIWYKIVVTYDGLTFNTYINDTLKSTYNGLGTAVGTSTDSISIGYDVFEAAAGYPYPFKGVIDDIRIYNRVLTDSEIMHYGDTCGVITAQPASVSLPVGSNALFTVTTTVSNPIYQWQQDGGTGFVNLSNAGPYSGVYTDSLIISAITPSLNNYNYRCIITNTNPCADTSLNAALHIHPVGINDVTVADKIIFFPNPVNADLTIQFPELNSFGNVTLMNEVGVIVAQQNISERFMKIELSDLPNGVYFVKGQYNGYSFFRKILKN